MNINFDCSNSKNNQKYLYPIVRIDEQSQNIRIDEYFFKNLI